MDPETILCLHAIRDGMQAMDAPTWYRRCRESSSKALFTPVRRQGDLSQDLERNQEVVAQLLLSFPQNPPAKGTLLKAVVRLDNEHFLSGKQGNSQRAWARQEATALRDLVSYVRRVAKKNGKGARQK